MGQVEPGVRTSIRRLSESRHCLACGRPTNLEHAREGNGFGQYRPLCEKHLKEYPVDTEDEA